MNQIVTIRYKLLIEIYIPRPLKCSATHVLQQQTYPMPNLTKDKEEQFKKMYPQPILTSLLQPAQIDLLKDQFKNKIAKPWHFNNSMKIKNQIDRLANRYLKLLSDADIKAIVNVVYDHFKNQRKLQAQIVYLRFLHEMIIHYQRFRLPISEFILIVYSQVVCQIQNANRKYMLNELKIMYRLWYSYLDLFTLRKIREFTYVEARMDIQALSLNDMPLMKLISEFPKYLRERILNPIGPHAPNFTEIQDYFKQNQKDYYKWKAQKKEKRNEQSSSEGKQQSDLLQVPYESQQPQITDQNTFDSKHEVTNLQKIVQTRSVQLSEEKPSNEGKQSLCKLKQMYNKLKLLKTRRKGSKQLINDGIFQVQAQISNALQLISDLSLQKFHEYAEEWQNYVDEEWNYPFGDEQTNQPQSLIQKAKNICKFCFQQFQTTHLDLGAISYKATLCFYITRSPLNRFKEDMPCFRIRAQDSKLKDGVFILHRSCYDILLKGNIEESKWQLV